MTSCWKTYVPSTQNPWNLDRAKHLHRRAGFGATWNELQRDLADGHDAAIARMLNAQSRSEGLRADFESISGVISNAAINSDDQNRLKAWWLFRICFTPDPLQEKLALMWHNHFATSNFKVQDLGMMRAQNELFRKHASGKFGDLLHDVLHDPAMLVWLDAKSNRAGHPNENLARELMELFTLGVGHYSEADVKESARALTGWSTKQGKLVFDAKWHDADSKTILGQTSNFDSDSLAALLLKNDWTAHRLAWRMCDVFMGEQVLAADAVDELAAGLRDHDLDIRWAVETILRSDAFFAPANIGSRVSSPVEYVVGTVRSLELLNEPPSTLILAEWCTRLGQDLFNPPNVGGWKGGRAWLNSRSIIGRSNFASAIAAGELKFPNAVPQLAAMATGHQTAGGQTNGDQTTRNKSDFELLTQLLLSKPPVASPDTSPAASPDTWLSSTSPITNETVVQILSLPQANLT